MNHLIIFAHPNSERSFGRAIANRIEQISQEKGVNVFFRDLYEMNFNPILSHEELQNTNKGIIPEDIQQEHDFILQADLITLVYPLWWMGFPAILKGYLDRVLSHGLPIKRKTANRLDCSKISKCSNLLLLVAILINIKNLVWISPSIIV